MTADKWTGRKAQRLTRITLETYGDRCHLCGKRGATTADHLIPRSRGGTNSLQNLRPAHLSCNSRRGARDLREALENEARKAKTAKPAGAWRFFQRGGR